MILNCKICGNKFVRYGKQSLVAKCCSFECLKIYNSAKPNCTCTQCGKEFHIKKSAQNRTKRTHGYFCNRECYREFKKFAMLGAGNHQYGLRGHLNASHIVGDTIKRNCSVTDIWEYVPSHPFANSSGRVKKHILEVERNYKYFDKRFFFKKGGKYYLLKSYGVHHIDGNHDNNNFRNLQPLTRSEHTKLHNSQKEIIRDASSGKIIGVSKSGEFTKSPGKDNCEPSLSSNTLEGATTNKSTPKLG